MTEDLSGFEFGATHQIETPADSCFYESNGAIFGMRRRAKESHAKAAIKDIGTAVVQMEDDSGPKEESPPEKPGG